MYDYVANYSGTHNEALKDPYYSWLDGTTFNPTLSEGYLGSYANFREEKFKTTVNISDLSKGEYIL
ncbi:hypothetical protein N9F08_01085 [bacterium]|nr:hypothetical protein [bacterium]